MKYHEIVEEGWFSKSTPIPSITEIVLKVDLDEIKSSQRRGYNSPTIKNLKDWLTKQLNSHGVNIKISGNDTLQTKINPNVVDKSFLRTLSDAVKGLNNLYPGLNAELDFVQNKS